jgi:gliding-associated putative ABC transporter substrate-binding component GldG
VLPYAEITYRGKTEYVNLIKGCIFNVGGRLDFDVFKAMRNTEYNLMSTLFNMTRERTATVGILTGHEPVIIPKERLREFYGMAMADLYVELDRFYNIIYVDLAERKGLSPKEVDVLMVMQPETEITEREKYEIDQFIMRGGKVLFMMDHEIIDWTIGEQLSTLTKVRHTNLGDMMMKWGVNLNDNLVQDLTCGVIDASTYTTTFGSSINAKPWVFNPRVLDFNEQPMSRNLNFCLMRFASSIDTLPVPGIQKTVLMRSSRKTRVLDGTQFINVDQVIANRPDDRDFNRGVQTFSLLLTGSFQSTFQGRRPPVDTLAPAIQPEPAFVQASADSAKPMVAIISDGEFAVGESYQGQVGNLPGDNKIFVLNLIDMLAGQDLISSIRVREVVERKLDKRRVDNSRTLIMVMNIVLPIGMVILFGLARGFLRRSRNRKLKNSEA